MSAVSPANFAIGANTVSATVYDLLLSDDAKLKPSQSLSLLPHTEDGEVSAYMDERENYEESSASSSSTFSTFSLSSMRRLGGGGGGAGDEEPRFEEKFEEWLKMLVGEESEEMNCAANRIVPMLKYESGDDDAYLASPARTQSPKHHHHHHYLHRHSSSSTIVEETRVDESPPPSPPSALQKGRRSSIDAYGDHPYPSCPENHHHRICSTAIYARSGTNQLGGGKN